MATVVGSVMTSHVPAIGRAIAKGLQQDPYWKPFFDGYPPVRRWLAQAKPDVAVVFYQDHGLNFFLDAMPTFAVGAAAEYVNADEGWGIPTVAPIRGDASLSWHVIEQLVADEFDVTTCQRMKVDHALTLPLALFWPGEGPPPVRVVPIAMNHVQHPLPSPKRAYALGESVGRALATWDADVRVVVVGTGGLSHQLDGQRAGFINKPFDLMCMDALVDEPRKLTKYSALDIVREAGAQGTELMAWIAARAALGGRVSKVHSNYHVPISNTAAGLLALANDAPLSRAA
ncbi:MAG: class III extradiol dioxygenase family protein [Betaproteobacteria bacterium]|jgi:protocatechuate 4,5-dioxygenase beta chain|nr:class III extradiol dioxygenase family protein [Betaproteobacteria bacterium]MDH5285342.1 class III extradiol dioxygenase family protein [Betaproteobacteria bacterium]